MPISSFIRYEIEFISRAIPDAKTTKMNLPPSNPFADAATR
jgi:hypothetical protein